MSHRLVAYVAVVLLASACSPAPEPSTPQPPISSAVTAPSAPPAVSSPAASAASAPATAPAAASPFASWTGEPARDTMPPGLSPLTDEEAVEADKKCKPMQDALATEARKIKGKPATEAVLDVLARPPKVKGVDVARCADLIRRDLLAYRAKSLESDAIQHLTIIARSVQNALEREPRTFCPAASAVPADFSKLQNGASKAEPKDWENPGWQCLKTAIITPQFFQYRFETDEPSQTFVVVAKGYPVAGKPPVELFLRGKIEGREVKAGEVLRRK